MNTARYKIYMVGIHPTRIALAPNSEASEGSAKFIEEPTKGVKNEARIATKNMEFLLNMHRIQL